MSKGSKQQYKQFAINTLEDGCLVLKSLIVPVIIDLEKFKDYSTEAETLLNEPKSDGVKMALFLRRSMILCMIKFSINKGNCFDL